MHANLIFDMDGTLWDSSANVARSWSDVIAEYPNPDRTITTEEDIRSVMGHTMDEVAALLFPRTDPDLRRQIMSACAAHENAFLAQHGGKLYPRLEKTLQELQSDGHRLFIVSNCQSGYIEAFLGFYDFGGYFSDFDCFGNTGCGKDGTIRLLADRWGLGNDFYYIGDIRGDYIATLKAGGRFIHAAYGFGRVDADVPRIEAISDLPDLLSRQLLPGRWSS